MWDENPMVSGVNVCYTMVFLAYIYICGKHTHPIKRRKVYGEVLEYWREVTLQIRFSSSRVGTR